ncbi:MAG: hypothetical protein H7Z43_12870 [Clostridia bacterium]|nr:hypothetical protein [Deltaproteobacteria bacterium]
MQTTFPKLDVFSSPSYLTFDVRKGVLASRMGTRLCLLSEDFLNGFINACEYETGPAAPLVLRKCGRTFGARLARRFEDEASKEAGIAMRDRMMAELDELLRDFWGTYGLGALAIGWSQAARGVLPVSLKDSPMARGAGAARGDEIMTGMLEGFINHFGVASMRVVQTRVAGADGLAEFVAVPESVEEKAKALVAEGASQATILQQLQA